MSCQFDAAYLTLELLTHLKQLTQNIQNHSAGVIADGDLKQMQIQALLNVMSLINYDEKEKARRPA